MKFMRILPDTCASTRWPLSSSTRNIAFGSGSTTVPSTSIASSLAMRSRSSGRRRRLPLRLVSTSGPSSVIAMVCSKWAARLPSAVTAVQPSSSTRTSHVPHGDHGLDGEHHARP